MVVIGIILLLSKEYMGVPETKPYNSQVFKIEDWEIVQWEPYTNIKDPTYASNFTVYAHKKTPNLQIQRYQLFFNSQAEYISYLETYYDRKKIPNVVNSLHIEQTTKKSMCSTFHSASVYLERIHFRLTELIDIPVQEGLYIIESSLQGYEKMFQKTGFFEVSTDMIGINKQGKVKVWVNKNFSKNFPEFNKIDHNKSEHDFIIELLKIIEQCIDYPNNILKLSDYILEKKSFITFQTAKKAIRQYEKIYKYCAQKSLKSIVQWIKKNSNKQIHSSSEILNQLKTSSYSIPSYIERNFDSSKKNQFSYNLKNSESRKLQINKLKNKPKNKPIQNNIYYAPVQVETLSRQTNETPINSSLVQRKGAIHMSFIKGDIFECQPMDRVQIQNNLKSSTKTISKLPSVSFSYKNSGLYSPQNMQLKQNEWFKCNRQQKTQQIPQRERKKDFRKSLNYQAHPQQIYKKLNFYCSNGLIQQVDPDIAKDLFSLTKADK